MKNQPRTKLTKLQYEAMMDRVMKRQVLGTQRNVVSQLTPQTPQLPPGLSSDMEATPLGMEASPDQALGSQGGMPLGSAQQALPQMMGTSPSPASTLPESLGQSQEMWQGMKGGPGESIWNLLHQSGEQGGSPEDAFHQQVAAFNTDPSQVKDEGIMDFISSLMQHSKDTKADKAVQDKEAIRRAMMEGL